MHNRKTVSSRLQAAESKTLTVLFCT